MKFAKYNGPSKTTIKYVGSGSGSGSSGAESTGQTRMLWGNEDTGGNINDNMFVNGSIYLSDAIDEDLEDDGDNEGNEQEDVTFETRSDDNGGNIYGGNHLDFKSGRFSDNTYANEIYLNYPNSSGDKVNILELFKYIMPKGSIIMHNGSISKEELSKYGWAICDGSVVNGITTPNLKDKFVMGCVSSSQVGSTGGSATKTLSVNEMPAHSHSVNGLSVAYTQRTYSLSDGVTTSVGIGTEGEPTTNITAYHGLSQGSSTTGAYVSGSVDAEGDGEEFSILPPYYSLIYIMRIA